MKKLILGPPGTGKTTKLLNIVDEYLESDLRPERIAFVTFTKSGAITAVVRACDKFDMPDKRFPNFRTLHSMAYRETGCRGLLGYRDYKELGEELGYSVVQSRDDVVTTGTIIAHVEEQARTRCIDIEEAARILAPDINPYQITHYAGMLRRFKAVHGKPDFTDLLENYVAVGQSLDVDVVIVDEAQDLTELQWRMVDVLAADAQDVYYAGDDDQTIHVWAGASINRFMSLGDTCDDVEVLDHSYRLPEAIFNYAQSIGNRIAERYEKNWTHNGNKGSVTKIAYNAIGRLPLSKGESWLLLSRNKRNLDVYRDTLRNKGLFYMENDELYLGSTITRIQHWEALRKGRSLPYRDVVSLYTNALQINVKQEHRTFRGPKGEHYTMDQLRRSYGLLTEGVWFEAFDRVPLQDRKYIQACLRNGESPSKPRINLMTMHGSKGREADNVALLSDCSRASKEEMYREPDSEHRVFYVGATRAKKNLYIIGPSQDTFYKL